jgi:hypothetical protein
MPEKKIDVAFLPLHSLNFYILHLYHLIYHHTQSTGVHGEAYLKHIDAQNGPDKVWCMRDREGHCQTA